MIKKKVCILGSFAVGKTSLVQQYVNSIFSEKYLTTIGVKIDQKNMEIDGEKVTLLLWDIHGEDEFQKVPISYLRGCSGYFLVMDGTRPKTLEVIAKIKQMADQAVGEVPFFILVNKVDLREDWRFEGIIEEEAKALGSKIIFTSAKTGEGVEEAFFELTKEMLA